MEKRTREAKSGTTVIATIEREEIGTFTCQVGGHISTIGIDREVHQSPFLKLEDEIVWVPVILVLVFGILPGLASHGILEFKSNNRDSVETQDDIEGVVMFRRIFELTDY